LQPIARTAVVLACLAALAAGAAPAQARNIGPDDEIVLTGTVRVPRGEHADRILIGDGRVDIDGHVDGVVFALDAPVRIGRHAVIDGDVIAVSRRVTVERGAILNHDLVYLDDKPIVRPGAMVYGDVRRVGAGDVSLQSGRLLLHAAIWIAFTFSSLVLGLLFVALTPGAADAAWKAARERSGAAIGWGLALFLGLPVLAAVAVATLVGIPLGLLVLLSMLPLYALGYVATAYALGRALLSSVQGRAAVFLGGWAILRLLALVPVLGSLVWLAATVYGLGLLTVALWQSRGPARPSPESVTSAA
jgi:cytoskeletal protein CcmA (bactofilin family)